MGSERHDCSTYCQDCLLQRRKKNGESPIVSAFFKLMLEKTYDVTMVVPPTISKQLKSLLGKKVTLEDSDSRKWDVHLSNVKGSLAFQKGWRNFVQDNGIELGDFLEFNYFSDSRFHVDIYGSNGCQKIFPGARRTDKNRTTETATSSILKKNPYGSFYEQSARKNHFSSSAFSGSNIDVTPRLKKMKKLYVIARNVPRQKNIQQRSKVIPVSETLEEPCFMNSQGPNFVVEDDRYCHFDLSAFEMRGKKTAIERKEERVYQQDLPTFDLPEIETDANGTAKLHPQQKTSSHVSGKFHNAESGVDAIDIQKCPIPERDTEVLSDYVEADFLRHECAPLSSNSPNADLPLESIVPLNIIRKPKSSKFSAQSGEKMRLINQKSRVFKQEVPDTVADSSLGDSISTGGSTRPIKQEAIEWKPDISGDAMADSCVGAKHSVCEHIKIYCVGECCNNFNSTMKNKVNVKPEPADHDAPSAITVQVACSVPLDSEDFLVLPEPFPVPPQSGKINHMKSTQALVYLRDPAQRLWPVVYHLKNGFNVLASGWKTVVKTNDIQPGDKCIFMVENSKESTFTLQVVHN